MIVYKLKDGRLFVPAREVKICNMSESMDTMMQLCPAWIEDPDLDGWITACGLKNSTFVRNFKFESMDS